MVLDPFSGSGTTAVVAEQLGRRWLACDNEPQYNEWAIRRIAGVMRQPEAAWIGFDTETAQRRESIR
jgi:site-specific DNA-methyltransferase (adenine-specific)